MYNRYIMPTPNAKSVPEIRFALQAFGWWVEPSRESLPANYVNQMKILFESKEAEQDPGRPVTGSQPA